MPTLNDLPELVDAGFSLTWVRSHEPEEVERAIQEQAAKRGWVIYAWDCARGIRELKTGQVLMGDVPTPAAGIRHTPWRQRESPETPVLLLLHNLHRFADLPPIAQAIQNEALAARKERRFLVAVSPVTRIPAELEKITTVIEHPLPDTTELARIAEGLMPEDSPATWAARETVGEARGLTRVEAENAFTLSLVRHNGLDRKTIWELKGQALEKTQALKLHRGGESFGDLGGLASLKDFCSRALGKSARRRAKGVMLLGVPGSGKSCFAKALGNETGRPTLLFDVGQLMSKFVGESEQNLRQALDAADAMAPAVLFIDEVEKALAGGAASQSGDSGVSRRLFGALLTWLNDHESDVFIVCTANDVRGLPPEFARSGRFDATFFLDLPGRDEKDAIWELYARTILGPAGIVGDWGDAIDQEWTGAEIRHCCETAVLLDCSTTEAAQYVVPVAISARDQIEALRDWAAGRCLSAATPGRYSRTTTGEGAAAAPRRRIAKARA